MFIRFRAGNVSLQLTLLPHSSLVEGNKRLLFCLMLIEILFAVQMNGLFTGDDKII